MDTPETLDPWVAARDGEDLYFNATAVAMGGRGVLLLGPSGSGKSSAALGLMAHGAALVADDGVWLRGAHLEPPKTAPALIEARGIGLLNAGPLCRRVHLSLVVVLGARADVRLPPRRFVAVHDQKVTLIRAAHGPTLVDALLHVFRHGCADV